MIHLNRRHATGSNERAVIHARVVMVPTSSQPPPSLLCRER